MNYIISLFLAVSNSNELRATSEGNLIGGSYQCSMSIQKNGKMLDYHS